MSVRVRFAPSPTGYLHVGGLRTALYNYLFARKNNGSFILRIEDTDRSRLVENAVENLIESLSWAGIEFDESPVKGGEYGPYIQSERLNIYSEHINILLNNDSAYYAFDTTEELDEMRKKQQSAGQTQKYDRKIMRNQYTLPPAELKKMLDSETPKVIRLKVPEDSILKFNDIIRGEISVSTNEIDDQVLLKSDGFPTYHLANVVDDYLMKISHVIRGEEWLPSTPKHVLLYEAFGWKKPMFAHLPLLLNPDKSKLSKRQGDVAVEDYRSKGFFKEAVVNFVALLGWNPTADREIYTINELIESFNLEKVNKGGAVFDLKKLEWMNFEYLKVKPISELAELLIPVLNNKGIKNLSSEFIENLIKLFRERVNFLHEIPEIASYMFYPPKQFDLDYLKKYWKENTLELINPLIVLLQDDNNWFHENLHNLTKNYAESIGSKLKDVIHPLRLMITGKSAGAGMFETMELIGKDNCIERLKYFINNKKYEL
jgi:glutamyl-tRNA synthetase